MDLAPLIASPRLVRQDQRGRDSQAEPQLPAMRPHAYLGVVRKGRSADRIVSPTRRIVAQDTLARSGWSAWRKRRVLALLSLLCAGWVACGGRGGRDEGAAPLILGYTADLQTLNPLVSTDQNANDLIYHLLYTPLVTYDSTYTVRPWLAESWEFEGETVVFTLRDDVRWHDGEPVSAHDVKFTFDMAKDERSGSPLGAVYLADVTDAEVLDPYRIRFTLASLGSQPLESFYWPPVPRHLLEGVPSEEMSRHPFGRSPVGSGPYRLVRWQAGEQLVFEKNEAFAPSLGGPPAIGRVLYRIVPERTTLLSEFIRGEVDVHGTIGPSEVERVEGAEGVRVVAFPWRMFTYIGWNTRREPFESAEMRTALALAIDRRELREAVLGGRGSPASGPIPPWHPLSPGLEPLPYAPDSAAAILEALGWRDSDGDGGRERDGTPLEFTLLSVATSPVLADVAQIVQAQLARVGVLVQPQLLEWQTVLGRHRARDFDAVLTNWVLDNFRVDPRPLFHSSQAAREGSANRSSYANPVTDSLMDLGVTLAEESEARAVWTEFARILQREQPITFLFWNEDLAGVRAGLEGVRMDARGELVTLPRWRWASTEREEAP